MTTPFQLHDIGHLLGVPSEVAADVTPLNMSPFSASSLLRLKANAVYEPAAAPHEERIVVVLGGYATVTVDDCRQTLGSGQLLTVEPGASLKIWNDSDVEWSALCIESPPANQT